MIKYFLVLLFLFASIAYSQTDPFTVEIEQVTMPGTPNLHSFAFAQANGKWLFIGGRTNGLHSLSTLNAFPRNYANSVVYVVDPSTGQIWSTSLYNHLSTAAADPLRSTNMQFVQAGDKLYMTGGYGVDTASNTFKTFPVLTVVDITPVINAVINNSSLTPYIRQLTDTRMQITGGDMKKLGDYFYLMLGHNFNGQYTRVITPGINTQQYSNEIRKFKISDNGTTLGITDYSALYDSVNFHRRDMNVSPYLRSDMQQGLAILGGVFRHSTDLPFQNPVFINPNGYEIDIYEQKLSQYTCPVMPVFNTSSHDMFFTFFGGMSLYYYDESSSQLLRDSLVPFIDDITVLTKKSDGTLSEKVQPVRFPTLLGTNASFILNPSIAHFDNEVIDLQSVSGRTLAGYIFGGIKTSLQHPGNTNGVSTVSDYIFKVFITRNSVSIHTISSNVPLEFNLQQNFPNPFNPSTKIIFDIPERSFTELAVYDILGKKISVLLSKEMQPGTYEAEFNASGLGSGIYFYRLNSGNFRASKKMFLVK